MHYLRSRIGFKGLMAFIVISAGVAGAVFAEAPLWNAPVNEPPVNNIGQPPTTDSLTDYVRKSILTTQRVRGPVDVNQDSTTRPIYLGSGDTTALRTRDTSLSGYSYPSGYIGIHGYGAQFGVYGYSGSTNASGSAGVVGRSSERSTHDAAALFYGPMQVRDNAANGSQGSMVIDGNAEIMNGLYCSTADCDIQSVATWLQATNLSNGTALFGTNDPAGPANIPGISVIVGDTNTQVIGPAVRAYSVQDDAVVGFNDDQPTSIGAVYGRASGAVSSNQYIGIASISNSPGGDAGSGIRGDADGGLGSRNYSSNPLVPRYDMVAGVRACVKDATGAIVNKKGVYSIGGLYAAYFDGDVTPTNAEDGFNDGNVMITGRSYQGGALVPSFNETGRIDVVNPWTATGGVVDPATEELFVIGVSVDGNWRIEKRSSITGALITGGSGGFGGGDGIVEDLIYGNEGWNNYPYDIAIDSQYLYIVGHDANGGSGNNPRWRIEKRRRDNGRLCTASECGTAFDGDGYYLSTVFASPFEVVRGLDIDTQYMYVVGGKDGGALIEKRRLSDGALCTAALCGADFNGTQCTAYNTPVGCNSSCDVAVPPPFVGCRTNFSKGQIMMHSSDHAYDAAVDAANSAVYVIGAMDNGSSYWLEKRSSSTGVLVSGFGGSTGRITLAAGFRPWRVKLTADYVYVMGEVNGVWRVEKRKKSDGGLCSGSASPACDAVFDGDGIISVPSTFLKVEDALGSEFNYRVKGEHLLLDGNFMYLIGGIADTPNGGWRIEKRLLSTGALCTNNVCGQGTNFGSAGYVIDDDAGNDVPMTIDSDPYHLYAIGGNITRSEWRIEKRSKSENADIMTIGNRTLTKKALKAMLCKSDPVKYAQYCP